MAIYRNVHLTFWSDIKVTDEFTPEDRYFYLYLLTNPHTNLSGCYEISEKQISREMGYTTDSICGLIKRFSETHKVIRYNSTNKEILLLNWNKYNWTKSSKFITALEKEISSIKTEEFKNYLNGKLYGMDTVSFSDGYGMDTTVTVSDTDINKNDLNINNNNIDKDNNKDIIKRIVDYLNNKCNTRYKHTTENTVKHINARLSEGYSEDDFYTMIDKKYDEWAGTKMEKYLRPETLFRQSNFESYINQKIVKDGYHNRTAEMLQDSYAMMAEWLNESEENGNAEKRISESGSGN